MSRILYIILRSQNLILGFIMLNYSIQDIIFLQWK